MQKSQHLINEESEKSPVRRAVRVQLTSLTRIFKTIYKTFSLFLYT